LSSKWYHFKFFSQNPSVKNFPAIALDGSDESEYRILVDREFVKYLTIDPGLYDVGDMCFGPSLISMLPSLPPGDWNRGHISHNTPNGRPHSASVAKAQLPEVTDLGHPLQIDHLELHMGRKLPTNAYEATRPRFNSTIIAKFARFAWETPQLDAEISAYQWIENHQIDPKFLGHISEEGRVIGLIVERITDCRHATPEDLSLCQLTLLRLHQLGIKHGDIDKHNFLVHDGEATLIDFDNSTRYNDAKTLDEEFRALQEELQDVSGRGGRTVESDAA
jgi:hypothetical protein